MTGGELMEEVKIEKNIIFDDDKIDISKEVGLVWNIAKRLRGVYEPSDYENVIIPMLVIRRFECALAETKENVLREIAEKPNYKKIPLILQKLSGYQFYNTSEFDLTKLLNDSDNILTNFKCYLDGFSENVKTIIKGLSFDKEIEKMYEHKRLIGTIRAFSELDLSPKTIDNIKMGYMFEAIIREFSENKKAGDHYTPREIIGLISNILMAEGSEDLLLEQRSVKVLDFACGTGGMLATTYNYLHKFNPSINVYLYGQEINDKSHAICLADMMIKGQNPEQIKLQDTLMKDSFPNEKMRFIAANPPFGESWGGKGVSEDLEKSINNEHSLGLDGRFGAGLPSKSDSTMLFIQHAISKMDDDNGRAAIVISASPLFSGGASSGESQIRKYMLDKDLIEAIIKLPSSLFYNTGIGTYLLVLSKNKAKHRKGKVQLVDGSSFYTKMKKSLGEKRNELREEDVEKIIKLYTSFEDGEYSKIFPNEEFLYRESSFYQPMQCNYALTHERIDGIKNSKKMENLYNPEKMEELKLIDSLTKKEEKTLEKLSRMKPIIEKVIDLLKELDESLIYKNKKDFDNYLTPIIKNATPELSTDERRQFKNKLIEALAETDKTAEIQYERKKGKEQILLNGDTKDVEIIPYQVKVEDYIEKEVKPFIPDAIHKPEEDKIGAEIPFTRYFYKYVAPHPSNEILEEIKIIEEEMVTTLRELLEYE